MYQDVRVEEESGMMRRLGDDRRWILRGERGGRLTGAVLPIV